MKRFRHGKFRFLDYLGSWCGIAVLLLVGIYGIVSKSYIVVGFLNIVFALVWFLTILIPLLEKFEISGDSFVVYRGAKKQIISIPQQITIIISDTDICPPLTVRTAFYGNTHILKDKITATVLQSTNLEYVINTLHKNHTLYYTSSMIKNLFDGYRYIYSFVCNDELLEILMRGKDCQLIIPNELRKTVCVNADVGKNVQIHVDTKTVDGSVSSDETPE